MRISDWSSDVCSSDLVRDKYAEQRSVSLMNGRQVTSFSLEKAKGSSDVSVYDQAMEELNKIEKENPKIHFKQLYNSVDYTKGQYHSAMAAMVEEIGRAHL